MKPFSDYTYFISSNRSIWVPLNLKDLLTLDDILYVMRENKDPCCVMEEGIIFFTYGITLMWRFLGLSEYGGFNSLK